MYISTQAGQLGHIVTHRTAIVLLKLGHIVTNWTHTVGGQTRTDPGIVTWGRDGMGETPHKFAIKLDLS